MSEHEFRVGDRVLVPGVVTIADVSGTEVRVAGIELDVHANDLRPDTAGRDLTAQDVTAELWQTIRDYLDENDLGDELLVRLGTSGRLAAAGSRAEGTAPADARENAGWWRAIAEANATEIHRLRSEVAALRAAGDPLADAANKAVRQWRTGIGPPLTMLALADQADTWRSAAGGAS